MLDHEKLEPILRLAHLGYKVYPVSRPDYTGPDPGKSPWCEHGFHDGTSDVAKIVAWAEAKLNCNWGLCPHAGVVVLDADVKHGGVERLAQLEARHGKLPETPCCRSGGNEQNRHRYFTCPASFRAKDKIGDCEGLELISVKGGVIIPPSIHAETKKAYEWIIPPWEMALAPAPSWLLAMLDESPAKPSGSIDLTKLRCGSGDGPTFATLGQVLSGERNAVLPGVIGREFRHGFTEEEVLEHGLAWAEANDYDAAEMERKVKSIARKEQAKAQALQPTQPPTPERVRVRVIEDCSDTLEVNEERTNEETTRSAPAPDFVLSSSAAGEAGGQGKDFLLSSYPYPTLSEEAYHGLLGEIVRAIGPETEADPAGVLVSLLCCFGNAVGRSPYYSVRKGRHHANLFAVLVGETTAGKGDAWDDAYGVIAPADPVWAERCIAYGMGSGEGLVESVRDAETEHQPIKDEQGEIIRWEDVVLEPGIADKRLLCFEEEFVKPLALMRRDESTLSAHVRNAWGGRPLEVRNRKKNRIKATNAHVSILGHITPVELLKMLGNSVETRNGFLNRFLLCLVKRSKLLPDGGDASVFDRFAEPLASVLAKAKAIGEMKRTEEAGRLWHEVYASLAENKAVGTEKGRPQALKLAMLYALADGKAEIGLDHLKAGLAVWSYCEASAKYLFHNKTHTPSVGKAEEPLWPRLLEAIHAKQGISRTMLWDTVGRNVSGAKMDEGLNYLESNGLAYRRTAKTGGRDAEVWFSGKPPSMPDGYEERTKSSGQATEDAYEERTKKERSPSSDPKPDFVLSSYRSAERRPEPKPEDKSYEGGMGFVVKPEPMPEQAHYQH